MTKQQRGHVSQMVVHGVITANDTNTQTRITPIADPMKPIVVKKKAEEEQN